MIRHAACTIMLICAALLAASAAVADQASDIAGLTAAGKDDAGSDATVIKYRPSLDELFRHRLEKLFTDLADTLESGMEFCSRSFSQAVSSLTSPAKAHGALVKEAIDTTGSWKAGQH